MALQGSMIYDECMHIASISPQPATLPASVNRPVSRHQGARAQFPGCQIADSDSFTATHSTPAFPPLSSLMFAGVSYRMQLIAQPFREADVSSPIVTFSTLERPYCGNRQVTCGDADLLVQIKLQAME